MAVLTRPTRAITALCALFAIVVVTAFPTVAHGDEISDKKAQAAAIAAKIDDLSRVVEQYAEAANGAEIELAGLTQQVTEAEGRVAAAQVQLQQHQTELRSYAIDAYVKGGEPTTVDDISSDLNAAGQAEGYLSVAAGNRQQLVDQLRATQQDVQIQIGQLNDAKSQAQAKADDLNSKRSAAASAVAQQQALKNQVDSQLAQLVAAEQARRAQAAEAAAAQRRASAGTVISAPVGPIPGNGGASTAVNVALAQQGKPYQYGAAGPDSFDCSGLVMYAWAAAGVSLPHYVPSQYSATRHVSLDQIQPGDIIYYNNFGHDGIYIGGGKIVHAPHTGDVVKVVDMYYVGNPIAASRP